ncbi:MAG TPA: DNA primase [Gemmatimonadaceae bacterium]|nr:DNA primase [Gemmatimonadaceae bacterium]
MIPDETIERVRESADIVQVIGEYVELKRTGADWRGPCPFHQGTNRNFSVSPRRKIYYCFVCHEGGDVFTFLQKRLGVDWPAAVRMVAEKTGIEIREVERSNREGPDPRARFWEMNAAAAEYFQRVLWNELSAGPARDYLVQRGIDQALATRFQLGYAPREIGLMRAAMNALGYDDDALLEGGLMVKREEATEPRPRFRGRVTFPILDAMGRHVGFGGRVIGDGEPKYLNSPETPVFTKGKMLYGLNVAKLAARREERMLVVEGYFDAMRLIAAGIEETVAPLGTALTEDQAQLVARYAKTVYLLYDADTPGQKAAFRSGDELLRQGVAVHVVTLPDGEDPDTYVAKHGPEQLRQRLAEAMDLFERKVQILSRAGWLGDLAGKRRALERLMPTIRATRDPIMRDLYVARASEATGVSRELLMSELRRTPDRYGGPRTRSAGPPADEPPPEAIGGPPPELMEGPPPEEQQVQVRFAPGRRREGERRRGERRDGAFEPPMIRGTGRVRGQSERSERFLLQALLLQPGLIPQAAERLGPENFRLEPYRRIFAALVELGEDATVEQVAAVLSAPEVEVLQGELIVPPEAVGDATAVVADSTNRLAAFALDVELRRVSEAAAHANGKEKEELLARQQRLKSEIRKLGLKRPKTAGFETRRS